MAAHHHQPGGTLVLYQPQVDDWKNYQEVDARMAFTITPTGGKQHVGVLTGTVAVHGQHGRRTLSSSAIPRLRVLYFPSLDPATTAQMDQLVRTFLNPAATMTISLDRLVASVKKTKTPPPAASLNNDPPTIFVSFKPAILLLVNGAPTTAPIANSDIEFVVNANWPLFVEKGKFQVLPVRQQGLAHQRELARRLGRPLASCPRRCRRFRRTRISPA